MAKLKVVGSGSKGNCYIIQTSTSTLILELGVRWKEVLKALNYDISNVAAALASHIHTDHSKSIPDALKYNIPIYSNQSVAGWYEGVKALKPKVNYKIGDFKVMPLEVEHNCLNFAYIIQHDEFGKLMFCTDAVRFPYKVKGINHMLIEANYSNDVVIDNLCNNYDIMSHNENHMEIGETLNAVSNNYSDELNNIVLIHLSQFQSDFNDFSDKIVQQVGIQPIMAEKGLELEISKEAF